MRRGRQGQAIRRFIGGRFFRHPTVVTTGASANRRTAKVIGTLELSLGARPRRAALHGGAVGGSSPPRPLRRPTRCRGAILRRVGNADSATSRLRPPRPSTTLSESSVDLHRRLAQLGGAQRSSQPSPPQHRWSPDHPEAPGHGTPGVGSSCPPCRRPCGLCGRNPPRACAAAAQPRSKHQVSVVQKPTSKSPRGDRRGPPGDDLPLRRAGARPGAAALTVPAVPIAIMMASLSG